MIAGSEKESRSLMMDAAIRSVARYGFEGFTTKKWAIETGVAEGSLYYHFKSKDELLNETFFYIEQEIVELYQNGFEEIASYDDLKKNGYGLLESYYRFLIENPDKTLYYYRFRTSPRFNDEIEERQSSYYREFLAEIEKYCGGTSELLDCRLLKSFVLDGTASLAYQTITGRISDSEDNTHKVVSLLLGGVRAMTAV